MNDQTSIMIPAHGARFVFDDGREGIIKRRPPLLLKFPTGQVVAKDGLVASQDGDGSMVFARLEPGTYEVEVISIVLPPSSPVLPYEVVRGAMVVMTVSGAEPRRWEPAIGTLDSPGQFGVDYGFGALMDSSCRPTVDQWLKDEENLISIYELAKPCTVLGDGSSSEGAGEVLLYDCGMGDGAYPVWLGRESDGSVTHLVIDLEILRHGTSESPG